MQIETIFTNVQESQVSDGFPMDSSTWQPIVKEFGLSERERSVVELVLCGMEDREIETALGIAVPTIRTYLERVFSKAGTAKRRNKLILKIFKRAMQLAKS